ncbi:MAG: ABC transporter permease [Verrucomicrobiae bacterium]|jgi:lipopolysaccharide transport system permease protein|nr:ABC transporter permease [Verrucomicrobiae bacterium]
MAHAPTMSPTYISSNRLSWSELVLPWNIYRHLASCKSLLWQFTKREIERRYKGTLFGIAWSFMTPLLMLLVYTLVFGYIFGGSYGHPGETKTQFTLGLFCGLLLWDLIAGSIAASPGLIIGNANFVTKVIFPLEIIPIAMITSTLVHTAMGFIPLLLLLLVSQGTIGLSSISLIFIFVPILFYSLGISWILAALGVFLRDIGALVPPVITVLMFMSALFFPITAIPATWRWVVMLNPAAVLISMGRNALVFHQWPDITMYGLQLFWSIIIAIIGYALFIRMKPAFADVL